MRNIIVILIAVIFLGNTNANASCDLTPKFGLQTKGLSVKFANKSIGVISSVEWDFGDGEVSTDIDPQHFYQEEGMYTFTLTVANNEGCSETFESKVYVFDTREVSPEETETEVLATETPALALNRPTSVTSSILEGLTTYPNPVSVQAAVQFELSEGSDVAVKLFDMSGRMISVIAEEKMVAGKQEVIFQRRDLVSGTYLINVVTAKGILSDKVILQ